MARTAEAVAEAVAGQDRPPGVLLVQADLKAPASTGCSATTSSRSCPTRTPWWPRPSGCCAPAAAFVLAHSDFDTLIFASEDLELTRRLVRDYCDTEQSWMDSVDGTIGRRLADIAGRAGLVVEDVQAAVVLGRRFVPGEIGWGYARNLADTLGGDGRATPAELERWLAGLQRLDDRGAFLFSVNDYAVICGRMPR